MMGLDHYSYKTSFLYLISWGDPYEGGHISIFQEFRSFGW